MRTPLELRIALSAFQRPRRHRYGRARSQFCELHAPAGEGPFPVAVVLHGGYWRARYGRLITRPLSADLACRGWAAWNVEYRRIGRGQGGGWPATFDDVAAGIDLLADLGDPRLDLDRVVVVGHSAGGQLGLWAGGRPGLPAGAPGAAPRVTLRAVAALAAVADLVKAGEPAHALLGGTPDAVPDRYAQADPMRRIPLDVPVLLVHPRDDETVPVRRSRAYADAARAAGADVTLVEPAGTTHRDPIDPSGAGWEAAAAWVSEIVGSERYHQ